MTDKELINLKIKSPLEANDAQTYDEWVDWCNSNEYVIKEDKTAKVFYCEKLIQNINEAEISKLKTWFNTVYLEKEQKYRRLIFLNQQCDGQDPNVLLIELYKKAEINRARIRELEEIQ